MYSEQHYTNKWTLNWIELTIQINELWIELNWLRCVCCLLNREQVSESGEGFLYKLVWKLHLAIIVTELNIYHTARPCTDYWFKSGLFWRQLVEMNVYDSLSLKEILFRILSLSMTRQLETLGSAVQLRKCFPYSWIKTSNTNCYFP